MAKSAQRAEFILQELLHHGRVDADQLSQLLQVNLRRVHGGAVNIDMMAFSGYGYGLTFQENIGKMVEEKVRMAQVALDLIAPGDAIALSPGTTTTYLARAIRHAQIEPLTIVTNAVNIAMELNGLKGVTLTLTGGLLLSDFFALVGPLAEQSLSQMYVEKAFLGVTGLSFEYGLTGPNQLETLTHRLTMQRAKQTIILADASKIGRVALHAIMPITSIHTLITDRFAPQDQITQLRTLNIDVYLA